MSNTKGPAWTGGAPIRTGMPQGPQVPEEKTYAVDPAKEELEKKTKSPVKR